MEDATYGVRVEVYAELVYSDGTSESSHLGSAGISEAHPDLFENTQALFRQIADEMDEFDG